MYFPYLRGRQFELLAIRELVDKGKLGSRVIPIIEPIKPSSTLIKTLDLFIDKNRKIAIIHNPNVGNFTKELSSLSKGDLKEKLQNLFGNEYIIFTHIMNSHSLMDLASITNGDKRQNDIMVLFNNRDYIPVYNEVFQASEPSFTIIPDESSYRRTIKKNRILLADRFTKQQRNADYCDDEPFSEDHLYYLDDGYVGFSDYSIVGSPYSESGFAPYAVVIHIVYFDEKKQIRIKHFLSDSNDDFNDPAGKFYEALKKLVDWNTKAKLKTIGMKEFLKHYENGTYPGLGTVKKLSIMHHIELINTFLED
jgi:hypothetical protein